MSGRDSTAADSGSDATPLADAPDRAMVGDVAAALGRSESTGQRGGSLVADGGEDRNQPLAERSRQSIEDEIDDLEQNPERYETQDQAVIDRYEGLLAERHRREQAVDSHERRETRQRLQRAKNRLLRTLGLR